MDSLKTAQKRIKELEETIDNLKWLEENTDHLFTVVEHKDEDKFVVWVKGDPSEFNGSGWALLEAIADYKKKKELKDKRST